MSKFLKILFVIEIILILIIYFIALTLNDDEKTTTAYVVKEIPKEIEFKTFTKAICEERADYLLCHDELFVECNNIKLNLSDAKVNASGVFKKKWVDTRKQT